MDMTDPHSQLLLSASILANDATETEGVGVGDPTEIALVHLAEQFHVDEVTEREKFPRLAELAFDSDRKLMSTLHMWDGKATMMTKGAIDVLLDSYNKFVDSGWYRPHDR
jgi:Ca2+-transporting ATPase